MIALLTGQIAHKSPDHIILDVTWRRLPGADPVFHLLRTARGGRPPLCTSIPCVREDAIQLYGFRTRLEKSFFQLLISVTGVGPKLARDILSNIQPAPLAQALGAE